MPDVGRDGGRPRPGTGSPPVERDLQLERERRQREREHKHERERDHTRQRDKASSATAGGRGGVGVGGGRYKYPRHIDHGPFHMVWGRRATFICEHEQPELERPRGGGGSGGGAAGAGARPFDCFYFGSQVESALRELSQSISRSLGKTDTQVRDLSLREPYSSAGERALADALRQALDDGVRRSELRQRLSKSLSPWFLHTALEDKTNMMKGQSVDEVLKAFQNPPTRVRKEEL